LAPMIGAWIKPRLSVEAEYWRKLAVAVRRRADGLTNSRSKQTMMNVAQAYERRADQVTKEERGARIVSQAG
jgi:hypothetical protein